MGNFPENQPQPVYYTGSSDRLFRWKYLSVTTYAIALILFFLPFMQIKCGGTVLVQATGLQLATGSGWSSPLASRSDMEKRFGRDDLFNEDKSGARTVMIFTIAAAALIFIALIFSVKISRSHVPVVVGAGILAFVALLGLLIYMQILFSGSMKDEKAAEASRFISLQFTIWYYICMFACLFGAWSRHKFFMLEIRDHEMSLMLSLDKNPGSTD